MRRAYVLIVILLACLLLVACGKDEEPATATQTAAAAATGTVTTGTTATGTTSTTAAATAPVRQRSARDGCEAVPAPEPLANPDRRRPRQRLNRERTFTAILDTNCGTIKIRLDVRRSPKTTASFAALVRSKFFDGLTFHRIAKPGGNDYVVQGGDPLGTGNGGPGYSVVEAPPRKTRYRRYVVAMAKTQTEPPGSSGSQFFIVTASEAPLDPDYAVLGTVVGSKRAVRRIAALGTDPSTEMPVDAVVISSARIRASAAR